MSKQDKILIIKHGALGDMVQALDGFASVRAGHPDGHLALLTTKPFAGLARAMPFFDEVIVDRRAKAGIFRHGLKYARCFIKAGDGFMTFNHPAAPDVISII